MESYEKLEEELERMPASFRVQVASYLHSLYNWVDTPKAHPEAPQRIRNKQKEILEQKEKIMLEAMQKEGVTYCAAEDLVTYLSRQARTNEEVPITLIAFTTIKGMQKAELTEKGDPRAIFVKRIEEGLADIIEGKL